MIEACIDDQHHRTEVISAPQCQHEKNHNQNRGFLISPGRIVYTAMVCTWSSNCIQSRAGHIVNHPLFDKVSMAVILVNSLMMSWADYSHVDSQGHLATRGSPINRAIALSDIAFTVIFTLEFILKLIFWGTAYFLDNWNNLDFAIVIISWVSLGPSIPAIKVLRTLRVLRPLKSIKSYPVLAESVSSILDALARLRSFAIIFVFFLVTFGILGLQLFSGPYLHARCRLTPFPVNTSWSTGLNFNEYRCTGAPNFDVASEDPALTRPSSPWHTPLADCFWPVDVADNARLCSLTGAGTRLCIHDEPSVDPQKWRWCECARFLN